MYICIYIYIYILVLTRAFQCTLSKFTDPFQNHSLGNLFQLSQTAADACLLPCPQDASTTLLTASWTLQTAGRMFKPLILVRLVLSSM